MIRSATCSTLAVDGSWTPMNPINRPDEDDWRVYRHSGESGTDWVRTLCGDASHSRDHFRRLRGELRLGETVRLVDSKGRTIEEFTRGRSAKE